MSTLLTRVAITVTGITLGGAVARGVRGLMRAHVQHVRLRRSDDDAHRVTVSPDGGTTTVINLDSYRHRRHQHDDPGTSGSDVDDGPA